MAASAVLALWRCASLAASPYGIFDQGESSAPR